MNCWPTHTVEPPTAKSSSLVKILRILMYVQLIVAIMKFFTPNFASGFYDLMSCLILYNGYTQLSFYNMAISNFFNGISLVQILANIGTIVQDKLDPLMNQVFDFSRYTAVVNYISIVLYLILFAESFQAYKEFKAIAYERSGPMHGDPERDYQPQHHQNQRQHEEPRAAQSHDTSSHTGGFKAFSGRGVSLA